ncbi:MAG: hypothetical protein MPW14_24520 [Candidatus Manganitrophus sp.]|nr:MAG: hypothetical protein MPW14_24520 [Candidatus Manganitrophus sp.]
MELFIDPAIAFPKLKIGGRLLQKALGFRTLLDVIPLDASLVKGSHGRPTDSPDEGPLFITQRPNLVESDSLRATGVWDLILSHLVLERGREFSRRRPSLISRSKILDTFIIDSLILFDVIGWLHPRKGGKPI